MNSVQHLQYENQQLRNDIERNDQRIRDLEQNFARFNLSNNQPSLHNRADGRNRDSSSDSGSASEETVED